MAPIERGTTLRHMFGNKLWFVGTVLNAKQSLFGNCTELKIDWDDFSDDEDVSHTYDPSSSDWEVYEPDAGLVICTYQDYLRIRSNQRIDNHDAHIEDVLSHQICTLGKCVVVLKAFEIRLVCKVAKCRRCRNNNMYSRNTWTGYLAKHGFTTVQSEVSTLHWSLREGHPKYEFTQEAELQLLSDQKAFKEMSDAHDEWLSNVKQAPKALRPRQPNKCVICRTSNGVNIQMKCFNDKIRNVDARSLQSIDIGDYLLGNRICVGCTRDDMFVIPNSKKSFYCMMCRKCVCATNSDMCVACARNELEMLNDHAKYKQIFTACLEPLNIVLGVQILVYHERQISSMGGVAVDSVVVVKSNGVVTHMFMIEFQNTHTEHPQTLTQKYLHYVEEFKALQNHLWCVRITKQTIYSLHQKLDIIRSWMIFSIRSNDIPRLSCWMFWNKETNPLQVSEKDAVIPLSTFLANPVHLRAAPKGVKSDWGNCCDIYTMGKKSSKQDDRDKCVSSTLIRDNEVDVSVVTSARSFTLEEVSQT